jgi:hypothetical protein
MQLRTSKLIRFLQSVLPKSLSMEKAKASREVTQALNALYANAIHLMDSKSRPPEIFGEIFKQLDTVTQARRTRLHLSTGIVPELLWRSYIAAQY